MWKKVIFPKNFKGTSTEGRKVYPWAEGRYKENMRDLIRQTDRNTDKHCMYKGSIRDGTAYTENIRKGCNATKVYLHAGRMRVLKCHFRISE